MSPPAKFHIPLSLAEFAKDASKPQLQAIEAFLNALRTLEIVLNRNGNRQPPVRLMTSGESAFIEIDFRQKYPSGVPDALGSSARLASVNGVAQSTFTGTVSGDNCFGSGPVGFTTPGDFRETLVRINQLCAVVNQHTDMLNLIVMGEKAIQRGESG